MSELKPCPFCGGEAAHDKWDEDRNYAGCRECDFWLLPSEWNSRAVSEGVAEKLLLDILDFLNADGGYAIYPSSSIHKRIDAYLKGKP